MNYFLKICESVNVNLKRDTIRYIVVLAIVFLSMLFKPRMGKLNTNHDIESWLSFHLWQTFREITDVNKTIQRVIYLIIFIDFTMRILHDKK